jgi:hypothetical protein
MIVTINTVKIIVIIVIYFHSFLSITLKNCLTGLEKVFSINEIKTKQANIPNIQRNNDISIVLSFKISGNRLGNNLLGENQKYFMKP